MAMLQPHSILWHYLWVGPDVLLAVLAILVWRRELHKVFPAFFVYLAFESIQGLTLYAMDILPPVSAYAYWKAAIAGGVIEGFVKFAVVGELFHRLVRTRPSMARLGTWLILCTAAALVVIAIVAAVHAPIAKFAIVSFFQILEQTSYVVEAGVLLFIFLFAARFRLTWDRRIFGIALGLSISACTGLGVFAVYANGISFGKFYLLDFLDMAAYHVCVLLWFYYLLSPAWPNTSTEDTNPAETISNTEDEQTIRRLDFAQFISRMT